MFQVTSYGPLGQPAGGSQPSPGHLVNELNEPESWALPRALPGSTELPVTTLIRSSMGDMTGMTLLLSVIEREYCDGSWIIPLGWLAKLTLGDNYSVSARHKTQRKCPGERSLHTRSNHSGGGIISRPHLAVYQGTFSSKLCSLDTKNWVEVEAKAAVHVRLLLPWIGNRANFKRLCSQKMHKSRHSN